MNTIGDPPKCSVLIVEDDPATREALTKILAMLGYGVCAVASVAEGAALLDGQACAVLDLNLPDGLGTHVLRRIREEGRPMRVAVITASTDDALLTEARRLGAEVVLGKPLEVTRLLKWLERTA